jgi:hypothetical protein
MFRINQIITTTELLKHFRLIARHLIDQPEPILVTQRKGEPLVILAGNFFEDLLSQLQNGSTEERPGSGIREVIMGEKP